MRKKTDQKEGDENQGVEGRAKLGRRTSRRKTIDSDTERQIRLDRLELKFEDMVTSMRILKEEVADVNTKNLAMIRFVDYLIRSMDAVLEVAILADLRGGESGTKTVRELVEGLHTVLQDATVVQHNFSQVYQVELSKLPEIAPSRMVRGNLSRSMADENPIADVLEMDAEMDDGEGD